MFFYMSLSYFLSFQHLIELNQIVAVLPIPFCVILRLFLTLFIKWHNHNLVFHQIPKQCSNRLVNILQIETTWVDKH